MSKPLLTRRTFLQAVAGSALGATALGSACAREAGSRPNVLILLAD